MACPSCHLSTPTITKHVCGSFIRVTQTCEHCEAVNVWDSQPFINNIPAGNILLSASILFSGLLPEQTLRIFQNFGCASISTRTFYEHQQKYLLPAIFRTWDQQQQALISILLSDDIPLVLGGDGRAESPGHCAKFGSYTMIELSHKVVFDIQLVQVMK